MISQNLTSIALPEVLYASLFDALPGNSILLKNNPPIFTILAATPQYLKDTNTKKDVLVGRALFEAFPANPADPTDTGEKDLRASLTKLLAYREPQQLPAQRYDIKNEEGSFEEHYWQADNKPVFNKEGEVAYIIHTAVNITHQIKAAKMQRRIIEMEEANKLIKTQEENLYNLVLSAPIGICVMDAPGLISQIANKHFVEIAGKPLEEIVGQFYWDTFSLARPYYEAALNRVVSEGVTYKAEEVEVPLMRHGKKENVYVSFVYEPLKNEAGTVTKVVVWVLDNTRQVVERRKVEESEKNLRSTILQSPVAMCILRGPEFVVEIANTRMYELWGRSADVLEGKPVFEGRPEAAQKGLEEILLQVYTRGETYAGKDYPITVPRRGAAQTVYVDFVYEPFRDGDGRVTGVIAVATDVTEQVLARKRMEENESELQRRVQERTTDLRQQKAFIGSILDASLSGIYSLMAVRNINGVIIDFLYLFANNNTAKVLNLSTEAIVGASMLELIPENKTNGFFDLFCRVLQTGETVHDVTHFVTHNIDSWFDYVIVPVDQETLVVTTQDISEQKLASLQLEEQRNLLDSILTNSSNGISVSQVLRNEAGNVVDALTILANDAAIKFIGLAKDIYLTQRATQIEPNIASTSSGSLSCKRSFNRSENN